MLCNGNMMVNYVTKTSANLCLTSVIENEKHNKITNKWQIIHLRTNFASVSGDPPYKIILF